MDNSDNTFEQVTCFKCPGCSFFHVDKNAITQHFNASHGAKTEGCVEEQTTRGSESKPLAHSEYTESDSKVVEHPDSLCHHKEYTNAESTETKSGADTDLESKTLRKIKCGRQKCGMRFTHRATVEYHQACHFEGQGFLCPECRVFCSQLWRPMSLHLWRKHSINMELYSCDVCEYKTYSLSELNNFHRKTHEKLKEFLCDKCGKSFKNVKQLRNHKEFHEPSKASSTTCRLCEKNFSSVRLLKQHTRAVHLKLRTHLCSFCGYSSASQSALKMHVRQHTGEKPFLCPDCEYQTADHNSFRRHRMRHSGEKRYKCPHCSYASIQSSTFKAHLKNKHPSVVSDLVFDCRSCAFRTVSKDALEQHQITLHSVK